VKVVEEHPGRCVQQEEGKWLHQFITTSEREITMWRAEDDYRVAVRW